MNKNKMALSNETIEYMVTDLKKSQEDDRKANSTEHFKLFKLIRDFIVSADEKYATKSRVDEIVETINSTAKQKTNVKIEFIKTR
jgi:transcriptional regulator NrdR family protein